jgi:hypothetical protein
MYTQEKDPMIIPFNPNDDDNRASAIMAALLVVFGTILMTVSLWAFMPTTTSSHDQIVAPIHRGLPTDIRPFPTGKP